MNEEIENLFADLKKVNGRFSQIKDRLNLQDLGHHLRDGGDLGRLQQASFQEREDIATQKLETELTSRFDENTVQELLPIIEEYTCISEDICFSLGMKVGAKIILLLTENFETDI